MSPNARKVSARRLPAALAAGALTVLLAVPALPIFAAGWVGVGGAMRENTRSIAFGGTTHIFSGHKNFGVFRSTDGGMTWQQTALNEFMLWAGPEAGIAQVNVILTCPNYGSSPLLLAGTSSGKVYYSKDHGVSWCEARWSPTPPENGVTDLAYNPVGDRIYACTFGQGVFTADRSSFDSTCESAPSVFNALQGDACGTNRVMRIVFDGIGTPYACTAQNDDLSGGVYRYIATWGSPLKDGGSSQPFYSYATLAFGVSGGVPNSDLWLGSADGNGLWHSPDAGTMWYPIETYPCGTVLDIRAAPDYAPTSDQHIFFGTGSGWYEGFGKFDPLPGNNTFHCDVRLPVGIGVTSVAADPGWNPANAVVWLATTDGIRRVGPGEFPEPPDAAGEFSLFDISSFVPSPNAAPSSSGLGGTVFATSKQFGLFRSTDGGITYQQFMTPLDEASSGADIEEEITSVALHPSFDPYSACTTDNASTLYMASYKRGVFRSMFAGTLWVEVNGSGTTSLPITPEVSFLAHTPNLVTGTPYHLYAALNSSPPLLYRYFPLNTWNPSQPFPLGTEKITTLALPPNFDGVSGKDVFVGTESGLLKSAAGADLGSPWSAASFPPGAFGPVNAIAFHPGYPSTPTVFVARGGTGVFRCDNAHQNPPDPPPNFYAVNAGIYPCAGGGPTYFWDFDNNGQTSTQPNPTHVFDNEKSVYNWSCTVTYNGQAMTRTGQVKVNPPACQIGKMVLSATPSLDQAPMIAAFDADAMVTGCGTETTKYTWDFGDGSPTSTGKTPVHFYGSSSTPGTWTLTVQPEPMVNPSNTYTFTGDYWSRDAETCPWTAVVEASTCSGASPLSVTFQAAAFPFIDATSLAISPSFATENSIGVGVNHPSRQTSGGVFISRNGGTSWESRNNSLADRHVKALTFMKKEDGTNRLLCGTQRHQAFFNDSPFEPTDNPWTPAVGYQTAVGEIRAMVVSPVPPNFGCTTQPNDTGTDVFIGGTAGVFWSVDGGETFRPIHQGLMKTVTNGSTQCRPADVNCLQLFINPDHRTFPSAEPPPDPDPGVPTPMLLAGTEGFGIFYRYATRDSALSPWDWTNGAWQPSDLGGGISVKKFARERAVFPLRAATSDGVYTSPGKDLSSQPYGEHWVPSGGGPNFTDIRHGQTPPEKEGNPEAPSGNASWGTVMGTGVKKGDETTLRPETVTWSLRNGGSGGDGVGVGAIGSLNNQSVIPLTSGTVLCGTSDEGVFRTMDEGMEYWDSANAGLESSSLDVEDFLEVQVQTSPAAYDILCAVNGSSSDGGIFLSGDDGRHWVSISEGFDSTEQTLSTIVASEGEQPTYYAGTYTQGSYASTLAAEPFPTVTSLSSSTSTSTGGGTITVGGTGFQNSCPGGYGCIDTSAVVVFGEVDAPTTFVSSTELTATVPAHPGGTVTVSVRNPDTRTAAYSGSFTYTEVEGGSPEFKLTVTRDGSNRVVATWENAPSSGVRKIFRSPEPDFSVQIDERSSTGVSGSVTYIDTTGTNGYLYFYKVE